MVDVDSMAVKYRKRFIVTASLLTAIVHSTCVGL